MSDAQRANLVRPETAAASAAMAGTAADAALPCVCARANSGPLASGASAKPREAAKWAW